MNDLESKLIESKNARIRLIATDGVFSMDGYIAKLDKICELAKKYKALVHVDDSHATGFVGKTGRGSAEFNFTFPLWGKFIGYTSLFTGYGESLIDYNHKQTRFGVGIALNNVL